MGSFDEILEQASDRHGKDEMLTHSEASSPATAAELEAIPDDRWLSQATKCIFQAGFSWKGPMPTTEVGCLATMADTLPLSPSSNSVVVGSRVVVGVGVVTARI